MLKNNKKERKTNSLKVKHLDISKFQRSFSAEKSEQRLKKVEKTKEKKEENISNIIEESEFENFTNFFIQTKPKIKEIERPVEDIEKDLANVLIENAQKKEDNTSNVKYFDVRSNYSTPTAGGNYKIIGRDEGFMPTIDSSIKQRRTGEIETLGNRGKTNFADPNFNKMSADYNIESEQYRSTGNIEEIENDRTMPWERRKSKF